MGQSKGVANKVEGSDLIKIYDYMAQADGIEDIWDKAKSQMTSLSQYADGYKKLLAAGCATDKVIRFMDSLSPADQEQWIDKVLSSDEGKTTSGQAILTSAANKANSSWLWVLAAVGVGGYAFYKSRKKQKK